MRQKPSVLIEDPKREIRAFRVAASFTLGTKRAKGKGGFIDSVAGGVSTFYAEVVQNLRSWHATAPKLRELGPGDTGADDVEEELVSTALSSQDDPEVSEEATVVQSARRTRMQGESLRDFVARNGSRRKDSDV